LENMESEMDPRALQMQEDAGPAEITESQNGRGWKGPLWVI